MLKINHMKSWLKIIIKLRTFLSRKIKPTLNFLVHIFKAQFHSLFKIEVN